MSSEQEKRRFMRHPVRTEIQYGQNGSSLAARISDLSTRGLFIDTVNTLDVGETISFRFFLPSDPDGDPIRGVGQVAWKEDFVGMGIRFTRMPKKDWERLRDGLEGES